MRMQGVLESVLRKLPVYVPPWVMVMGAAYVMLVGYWPWAWLGAGSRC